MTQSGVRSISIMTLKSALPLEPSTEVFPPCAHQRMVPSFLAATFCSSPRHRALPVWVFVEGGLCRHLTPFWILVTVEKLFRRMLP